jgi:alpha-galactosidase
MKGLEAMQLRLPLLGIAILATVYLRFAVGVSPTADEMAQARRWAAAAFEIAPKTKPCFSFTYSGKPSGELWAACNFKKTGRKLDDQRTEHTLTWTDPKTGLEVRCASVEYADFPVVEWTVYFRNTGKNDTPIIENILALDGFLTSEGSGDVLLHHFRGDNYTKNSFEPLQTPLVPGIDRRFASAGGRPSTGEWPYYNLEWRGGGVMLAIGWPGQWACQFTRQQNAGVRVRAGQELTRFTLHPGEEVRTPLIALMFYHRDWIAAQNLWRRWMLADNFPKDGGKTVSPKLAGTCCNHFPGLLTNQRGEIEFLDGYVREGMKLDYWWIDAGWYPCPQPDWYHTGTWEVDRKRFPDGLRAVANHAHSKGTLLIVWFEPERVRPGTWLWKNHPEWLLGNGEDRLLNLGHPDAWKWVVNRIDGLITSEGVDLYRQDFNTDPLPCWGANEPADRQGITENKYVQGYLAFWDELRRRHPGMLIDSCASGGRRDDLETMRRSLPFLRSDYCTDPDAMQCHTYGFGLWLPYYRGATDKADVYDFRSNHAPLMMTAWDMRNRNLDYATIRKLIAEWRQVAPHFLGDFYPLTGYSTAGDVWMVFQFDSFDGAEGIVLAFRRTQSPYESIRVKLRGLKPDVAYSLTNVDVAGSTEMTGRELLEKGISIALKDKLGAAVITYHKFPGGKNP